MNTKTMKLLVAFLIGATAAPALAEEAHLRRQEVRTLATEDAFGLPNVGYEYFFGEQANLGVWARLMVPLPALQGLFPTAPKSSGAIGDVRFHHLFWRVGPGAFAYTVGGVLGQVTLTDPGTGLSDTTLFVSPIGTAGYHLLLLDDAFDLSLHLGAMYVVADYANLRAAGVRIPPPGTGPGMVYELALGWRF
jgi:hypothetical protein